MTTTPPVPTTTVTVDGNPCPRVEVVVSPMPSDANTVTVWRSWDGVRRVLRSANGVTTSGDFVVIDYEVPFGTAVTYTCQTVDSSGTPSQLSASSTAVTVVAPDVWVQDPLDPTSALAISLSGASGSGAALLPGVTVFPGEGLFPGAGSDAGLPTVLSDSFRTVTYSRTVNIAPVPGSSLPLGFGDVSQDASQVGIDFSCDTLSAAQALLAALRQAWPLCVRTGDTVPTLPGLCYLSLDSLTQTYRQPDGATLFTATGTSVQAPGQPQAVNVRTIDSLGDEAATIDGLGAIYDTIFDLERGVTS